MIPATARVVTIDNGSYGRAKTGRITSINASGTGNDWTYDYDGFGRLIGVRTKSLPKCCTETSRDAWLNGA
ncbi:hypothetical protein [Sinorhizobium saheli]|uniref:hypothetical protein n=1 Tax=Sinorhizobium saheli TaxID=36856 RepID=UPI001428A535|nr:hypothetical protein [Sinorhizobium saheli]